MIDGKVDTVLSPRHASSIEDDAVRGPQGPRPVRQARPLPVPRVAARTSRNGDEHEQHPATGSTARIVEGTSGRTGPVYNPATGEQPAEVDFASRRRGRRRRRRRPRRRSRRGGPPSLSRRAEVMFHLRELVDANRKEIASLLTAEHGKVLSDALGEVARGLENIEFACGIPHLLKGGYSEQASTGVDVYSIRQPLGVVAGITPFNFPAMVPMWMFANALACGNTFVLKPSEKDPSASLLHGRAADAGRAARRVLQRRAGRQGGGRPAPRAPRRRGGQLRRLDADRQVHLRDRAPRNGKRVQALGGAKNHMLVLPDADLDMAADAAVSRRATARPASGAWRSRVVLAVDVDRRRAGRPRSPSASPTIKVGPGTEPDNEMGPLITGEHRDKVAGYVDGAAGRGRHGRRRRPRRARPSDGFFLNPTLLDNVTPGMACYDDEIFGPVLSVVRVDGYDEGAGADQRQPVRQRHRDLHPRRRRRPPVPVRRQGRHGRRQRADPGAGQLLQLRRLEGEPVRRHPHVRPRGHQLLHPRQGRHAAAGPTRPTSHRSTSASRRTADAIGLEELHGLRRRPADQPAGGAGRRPGQAGRDVRVQPRVDVRLATSCGRSRTSSTARSSPRPARSSSGRWSPTRRPATGRSRRALFATLNEMYGNRTVCGIGRGDSAVRVTNGKPTTLATLRESIHVIRELANGREVDYNGLDDRASRGRRRASSRCGSPATGRRRWRSTGEVGDGFILQLADPDIAAWTIAAVREAAERRRPRPGRDHDLRRRARPTSATTSPTMRDQCRWFGGMVGNHVADIVGRYGDDGGAVPAGAHRLHQGPRGLRLQRARPGRQHPRRVRARRDRRPLLHPRPGRRAHRAGSSELRGARRRPVRRLPPARRQGRHPAGLRRDVIPALTEHALAKLTPKTVSVAARSRCSSRARSLVLVAAAWELYKRRPGGRRPAARHGSILPRANDTAMPHVWDMVARLTEPENRPVRPRRSGRSCSTAPWYSFRLAVAGFAARRRRRDRRWPSVMARFRIVERGLLPYLVVSQTVPLIALAPLVVSWGGKLQLGGWAWPRWLSASVLGAFLAFFPVAVGTLRGLQSPPADVARADGQLRRDVAQTLFKLRFPAAVPVHRAGAAGWPPPARDRRGRRRDLDRPARRHRPARSSSTRARPLGDPAKVYTAVFGAAVARARRWPALVARRRRRADAQPTQGARRRMAHDASRGRWSHAASSKVFNPGTAEPGRRARRHRPHGRSPASSCR